MSDEVKNRSWLEANGAQLILSAIVFGVVMELGDEIHSVWLRVLVGAVAGGILGLALLRFRKARE